MLAQYNRFVKPAYDDFIRPTMKYADIIVPFEKRNDTAVEMIIQNLKIKMRLIESAKADLNNGGVLRARSISEVMTPLARSDNSSEKLRESADSKSAAQDVLSGLILPSEKVQAQAIQLLQVLGKSQPQDDNDEPSELM